MLLSIVQFRAVDANFISPGIRAAFRVGDGRSRDIIAPRRAQHQIIPAVAAAVAPAERRCHRKTLVKSRLRCPQLQRNRRIGIDGDFRCRQLYIIIDTITNQLAFKNGRPIHQNTVGSADRI